MRTNRTPDKWHTYGRLRFDWFKCSQPFNLHGTVKGIDRRSTAVYIGIWQNNLLLTRPWLQHAPGFLFSSDFVLSHWSVKFPQGAGQGGHSPCAPMGRNRPSPWLSAGED
jgi:hypothetical protein